MKTTITLKTILIFFVSISFVVMLDSCKKDSSTPNNPSNNTDTTAANLSASTTLADNAYDDIFQTAVQTGYDNNIAYSTSSIGEGRIETNSVHGSTATNTVNGCAVYTLTPNDVTTFPKTVVVDFGSGCTSTTGITRIGKITYVFSGKLITPGTTVSASFTNYSVNGYQLKGTYSITNNVSLANGVAFTTSVSDGSIVFPDQTSYSYSGSKNVKQTAGITTTMDASDDVYSITGNNTFSANGNTIVNTITTPLSRAYSCEWIGSGIISFTYNTDTKGTLDFGNGTCDGDVTIKVGSFTKTITFQ
jgi:hypothetical protein